MLGFLVAALVLPSQECVSTEFEPGPVSVEEAFGTEITTLVQARWNPEWGRAVASVSHSDSAGLRVRVDSETGDSTDLAGIVAMFLEALAVPVESGEPLRLLIHDGSRFDLRTVAGFTTCPPQIRNRTSIGNELSRVVRDFEIRETTTLRPMVRIDPEGRVVEARLDESSGSFALDAVVLDLVRGWSFEPARNEGIAVSVWLRFPVTLQPRGGVT